MTTYPKKRIKPKRKKSLPDQKLRNSQPTKQILFKTRKELEQEVIDDYYETGSL